MKVALGGSNNIRGELFRRVLLITVLVFTLCTNMPAGAQGNSGPSLELRAPGRVRLGDPIEITITARHMANLAGYEAALLFDTNVAEFGGVFQRQNDLKQLKRDVSPLTAVDLPNGVAFGLASCATDDCVQARGPKKDKGANGLVRLGTLVLFANQPGALEVRLEATKFVDANGNSFNVTLENPTLVIEVDTSSPYRAAPNGLWQLPQSAPTNPGPFDLTSDGQVNHADLMEVSIEWEITHLAANPCQPADPTRDVNHDGCIDVADLQMVAAHYGAVAPPQSAPESGAPAAPSAEVAQTLLLASTFTVNSTGDLWDQNINGVCSTSQGECTLRAAIQEANAQSGPNTINFNIPGSGVKTIMLGSRLPTISDTSGATTIDGYTQPGAAPNTNSRTSNASILVQVEGGGESSFDGLVISSPGNVLRGLAFYRLKRPIWVYGAGADNNTIAGTFVGTNVTGSYGAPAFVAGSYGIHVEQGASSNMIGGSSAADRNVISGNGSHGVGFWHESTDANTVQNNIVGLNPAGTQRLANRKIGLDLNFGASACIFRENVISGNDESGIEISHTINTRDNQILNNYIGTDASGNSAPADFKNNSNGILIEDGASNNYIADNVIGNSRLDGIRINYGAIPTGNRIERNRIGISLNDSPIPNAGGLLVEGLNTQVGPDNIIAYNTYAGIKVTGSDRDFNTFTRNSIFNNGAYGIDLDPHGPNPNDAGDGDSGPNEQLNYPVLQTASTNQVTGVACGGCRVEIFIADSGANAYGEGKTFVGAADGGAGGAFTVNVSGVIAGQYVTATATDGSGNTSEFSLNLVVSVGSGTTPTPTPEPTPTPTPGPGGPAYAADSFSRVVNNHWGAAETGGSYALFGNAVNFDVDGSTGTILVPGANQGLAATLNDVSAQDIDLTFRVKTDKLAAGNNQFAYFIARRVSSNTEYRGQIRFATNQGVYLRAVRIDGGVYANLGTEVRVANLTHAADSYIWMRAQVTGVNPTTIRIKAWAEGQPEPASWQFTVTDAAAGLQTAGGVGLRANLPASVTNTPILFTFDDFLVTSP